MTAPDDYIRRARLAIAGGSSVRSVMSGVAPSVVGTEGVAEAGTTVLQRLEGAGPVLQPLLDDGEVTDVLVNGVAGVWVDRGHGLERISHDDDDLASPTGVRRLAVRLAATCGQRLDDASPIVDGTFPSGVRLHAVLAPLAAEGTLISLRTQRSIAMSLADLQAAGTLSDESADLVSAMVEAKANIIISGATGSGKTTLLAAVLSAVPADERIIVIEESAELRPRHPHVVHLQVRNANVQGAGEIPMSQLVKAAMRMRPDRLVLGECRGAEVRDVLSALNTGHEGGWATIHANTALDVPARLVALGALAGMSEETVNAQASSALDAVVHIRRSGDGRRVDHIARLERRDRTLMPVPVWTYGPGGGVRGDGWPALAERLGLPS